MKLPKVNKFQIFALLLLASACGQKEQNKQAENGGKMMVRLSEIEIAPEYLQEYLNILKEESSASVQSEPGVISIYPMFQKENPNEIRILEIYASDEAYQSHIASPNFKHYKATTLKMVKSLKLVDMEALDEASMPRIFKKLSP